MAKRTDLWVVEDQTGEVKEYFEAKHFAEKWINDHPTQESLDYAYEDTGRRPIFPLKIFVNVGS